MTSDSVSGKINRQQTTGDRDPITGAGLTFSAKGFNMFDDFDTQVQSEEICRGFTQGELNAFEQYFDPDDENVQVVFEDEYGPELGPEDLQIEQDDYECFDLGQLLEGF